MTRRRKLTPAEIEARLPKAGAADGMPTWPPKTAVMGRDERGVWHLTRRTYPNSMDTVCGLADRRATYFATHGHPTINVHETCGLCVQGVP